MNIDAYRTDERGKKPFRCRIIDHNGAYVYLRNVRGGIKKYATLQAACEDGKKQIALLQGVQP